MKRYERIIQILDEAVDGQSIGAHGAFWRSLNLEQFKVKRVFGLPLLMVGDGAGSNLVRALRGESPFGDDLGVPNATYPRMPVGFTAVPEERIAFIEQWITDGCPDDDFIGNV